MKKKTGEHEQAGRFSYGGLERVLHEKARLGIMTSLAMRPEGLLFSDLKRLCALTDGNLSRHLDLLKEARLVEVWKGFDNRRPQTLCRLSAEGRTRFSSYISQLEQVVKDATSKATRRDDPPPALPPGFQPGHLGRSLDLTAQAGYPQAATPASNPDVSLPGTTRPSCSSFRRCARPCPRPLPGADAARPR